ncbi:hypothetical protein PAXRUDRAFT_19357 [Paxillus rubicundulus Ve08.2h10]|uniref:Unplaced genomic scaffold scaffold_3593, whole genome shotgun sequence n=1 Tax=Paxillus rubicundulus Ve08.2h10 TaxID=930991 RepID=A0A0D0CIL2_9AGAM|nr:hypothetical protein PAXRUDRAFT_19357 [Paxillus rubicundulus Ve08.2h10]
MASDPSPGMTAAISFSVDMKVDIDIGIVVEQQVMEVVQDIMIQVLIAIMTKMNLSCLLSIIDVELSIARISSFRWQEASQEMMQTTMNVKGGGPRLDDLEAELLEDAAPDLVHSVVGKDGCVLYRDPPSAPAVRTPCVPESNIVAQPSGKGAPVQLEQAYASDLPPV